MFYLAYVENTAHHLISPLIPFGLQSSILEDQKSRGKNLRLRLCKIVKTVLQTRWLTYFFLDSERLAADKGFSSTTL